jgi:G3E family GTPase
MRTTVVSGLLGAGKTTFIRNVLADARERAVVLINDFGEAGVDGAVLQAHGIEAVELPSGCVCCTLRFDLITTISRVLAQFGPEHLVIEPSGVAAPSGVMEALRDQAVGPVTVAGIVDATEFLELHEQEAYGQFFRDQVRTADIILVNKTDLVDAHLTDDTVALVKSLNPHALVFATAHARLDVRPPEHRGRQEPTDGAHALFFETHCLRPTRVVSYGAVQKLLARLHRGDFGRVVRVKALLVTDRGPFRVELASGRIETTPFAGDVGESRLVIIGTDLRRDELEGAL